MSDEARLQHLRDITATVGAFCLRQFSSPQDLAIESKGTADFVTAADRQAEQLARQLIGDVFPGEATVGEESGGAPSDSFWIIDPIDGTANFMSGLPLWGVSIAYMRDGHPVLGAITIPALDILLFGGPHTGLRRVGKTQGTRPTTPVLFGIGRNRRWPVPERQAAEDRLEASGLTIVSLGSCAVSLALVALGHLYGYTERQAYLWDCAAGVALCEATGADVKMDQTDGSFLVSVNARAAATDTTPNPVLLGEFDAGLT